MAGCSWEIFEGTGKIKEFELKETREVSGMVALKVRTGDSARPGIIILERLGEENFEETVIVSSFPWCYNKLIVTPNKKQERQVFYDKKEQICMESVSDDCRSVAVSGQTGNGGGSGV